MFRSFNLTSAISLLLCLNFKVQQTANNFAEGMNNRIFRVYLIFGPSIHSLHSCKNARLPLILDLNNNRKLDFYQPNVFLYVYNDICQHRNLKWGNWTKKKLQMFICHIVLKSRTHKIPASRHILFLFIIVIFVFFFCCNV